MGSSSPSGQGMSPVRFSQRYRLRPVLPLPCRPFLSSHSLILLGHKVYGVDSVTLGVSPVTPTPHEHLGSWILLLFQENLC